MRPRNTKGTGSNNDLIRGHIKIGLNLLKVITKTFIKINTTPDIRYSCMKKMTNFELRLYNLPPYNSNSNCEKLQTLICVHKNTKYLYSYQ